MYLCFTATFNTESEVKTEQQETKIIRKNERYPHQHQQQKLKLSNEHSFIQESSIISSSEFSASSSNLILDCIEISNREIGQHEFGNEANIMSISTMDEVNVTPKMNDNKRYDSQNLTNEKIDNSFNSDKMINGNCVIHFEMENEEICAPNAIEEGNNGESGFRIDHFAECLAEDVLEDSLLEANAEISNQENKYSSTNQITETMTPMEHNDLVNNQNASKSTKDYNTSAPNSSCTETCLIDTVNSIDKTPNAKASDTRVHSKSLCLNDSNAYTETCSNFMTLSQLQPNSSCPQMDEKLKELTDLQQLVQNFPSEDIIPYDQDDECCSNSVVDGLDKLLSDDDIEEDMENLGNTMMDQHVRIDKTARLSQDDLKVSREAASANEYNLFELVNPQRNQAISPNTNVSNAGLNEYLNINRLSIPNDQDSNQWNRIENLCDKSSNVINSPEMLESLVSSELHHTYDNIRTKDDNIEAIVKTPEEHVLSNISSLLQYLPEQVEKLVVECDEGTEVCHLSFLINASEL